MSAKKISGKTEPVSPTGPKGTATFSATAALLALAAPAAPAPSPQVKARLLARIRAAQAANQAGSALPGWRFESAHDAAGWFALPVPGVRMKQLSVDAHRDVVQMLVEIASGARFPDHEHTVGDEGIVLSGDVFSGGRLLRAGVYYHAGAGTKHTDIVSPSGCVALVSFSVTAWNRWKAEMLAGAAKPRVIEAS